jgi:hypothetical protein
MCCVSAIPSYSDVNLEDFSIEDTVIILKHQKANDQVILSHGSRGNQENAISNSQSIMGPGPLDPTVTNGPLDEKDRNPRNTKV